MEMDAIIVSPNTSETKDTSSIDPHGRCPLCMGDFGGSTFKNFFIGYSIVNLLAASGLIITQSQMGKMPLLVKHLVGAITGTFFSYSIGSYIIMGFTGLFMSGIRFGIFNWIPQCCSKPAIKPGVYCARRIIHRLIPCFLIIWLVANFWAALGTMAGAGLLFGVVELLAVGSNYLEENYVGLPKEEQVAFEFWVKQSTGLPAGDCEILDTRCFSAITDNMAQALNTAAIGSIIIGAVMMIGMCVISNWVCCCFRSEMEKGRKISKHVANS